MFVFELPEIGEGVVEGEIVSWKVKAGDMVATDQPICEIMTDKATVEISSPKSGRVARLHGVPGDVVRVHSPLVEIDLGRDLKHYDPNFIDHPHHNHLICVDCDKVVEFEDKGLEVLEDCISRRLGFQPASKSIRIEANCQELQRSGVCKSRKKKAPTASG